MPRNGTGTYTAPSNSWNPPVNGSIATSTDWAATQADYVAALSQSVSADGQTPMTGNFPLGNNKITGLAPGTASTDAATYGQVVHGVGQCRLVKSGANLVLQPLNGNQIAINGALYAVPSAGVSLAPGAFTPSTLYFIYAYMVGTTMTLEASTTAHSTDINTGVEIKTGDATRTLVGMARPIAGPLWSDLPAQRFVLSWFNRRPVGMFNPFVTGANTSSTTYVELSSGYRLEFLTWSSEIVDCRVNGSASNSATATGNFAIAFDGTSPEDASNIIQPTTNANVPLALMLPKSGLSEGYHYGTLIARVIAGSGLIFATAGATAGERTATSGSVQG